MSADQFVAFQNIIWIVFALAVAGAFSYRYIASNRSQDGKRLMLGVILVSVATALHRGYWTLWRLNRQWHGGDSAEAKWFVVNADWIGVCVLVIAFGYSLHLYTVFRKWMGKIWWLIPAGMVGLSYVLSITLAG